jgi:general stress protein YciG
MAGTTIGGLKTVETNKKKYGEDFYVKIGALGGAKTGVKKGFAANPELARTAGAKGGSVTKNERKK